MKRTSLPWMTGRRKASKQKRDITVEDTSLPYQSCRDGSKVNHHLPTENWPTADFPPKCTASGCLTQMSAHLELESKTQNTSCQDCPTHTLERTRLWPSGADFRDKLWGSKEELQNYCPFHLEHPPPNLTWLYYTIDIWTQKKKKKKKNNNILVSTRLALHMKTVAIRNT